LTEEFGEIVNGSAEAQWLGWARRQADHLDPLKNGFLKTLSPEADSSEAL